MSTPPTPSSDANISIARAERRLAMLEALSEMGMALAKDICVRSMESPYHPELKHDPGKAFAAASRAVRLTLVLEARVDEYIFALRNGMTPALKPWGSATAVGSVVRAASRAAAPVGEDEEAGDDPETEGSREGVERESERFEEREGPVAHDRERLLEGRSDEALLDGDFDACVDVIRANLGLPPLPGEGRLGEAEWGGDVEITGGSRSAEIARPHPDGCAVVPLHECEGGWAICAGVKTRAGCPGTRASSPLFRSD